MRLIDADKLENDIAENITVKAVSRMLAITQGQPTVKAIPVEWIKNYLIPFQVHHDSLSEDSKENDGAGWVIDVLETMIREWEKENEID